MTEFLNAARFRRLGAALALLILPLVATPLRAASQVQINTVAKIYADIAEATYSDAHSAAVEMQRAINTFLKTPSEVNLKNARDGWIAARIPYMQTEVYRFGNKIVDAWEGKVNAWPLDEGLIDYVAQAYIDQGTENESYAVNVIANPSLRIGAKNVDASKISKELLIRHLHEAGGIEANVATGYHAIEFLLWGQDLHGTGPGAGQRPATDFDTANCTNGNCDRRAQYLRVVTDLLVDELNWMKGAWSPVGHARQAIMQSTPERMLHIIFTGLGSLTYGELAGERMKLGLMLHDPEEEHDCFSDTTHVSHYYDLVGVRNVYLGNYTRLDGSTVSGPSISSLVQDAAPETDKNVRAALEAAMAQMTVLKTRAETVEAYDQMIGEDNEAGNKVVADTVAALVALAKTFRPAMAALGLKDVSFEGSDSLDNPDAVGAP